MIDKIVIASNNPAKVKRYQRLLSKFAKEVIGLKDFGVTDKPVENGKTAEENAIIKAKFYAKKTGQLVFSEDESLFVDFLPPNKQPGVNVRRINGKDEATDEEIVSYWERIIDQVPVHKRTGRWHVAFCFAYPDGKTQTIACDDYVRFYSPSSMIKMPGWPMSSLQGPVDFGKPHSELTDKELLAYEKINDDHVAKRLKVLLKRGPIKSPSQERGAFGKDGIKVDYLFPWRPCPNARPWPRPWPNPTR